MKDGYEDFKHHQSDNRVNYSQLVEIGQFPMYLNLKVEILFAISYKLSEYPHHRRKKAIQSNPEFDYEASEKQGIDDPHWMKTSWEDLQASG